MASFTTPDPSFCPSGYSLIPAYQNSKISSSTTAAQLSALQATMCQNPSGKALEDVQGQPIAIAALVGAALAVAFVPGFLKIIAAPLALYAYCQMNHQKCNNLLGM